MVVYSYILILTPSGKLVKYIMVITLDRHYGTYLALKHFA